MNKKVFIDAITVVLKEHKIVVDQLKIKTDKRPSRKGDYKEKIDIHIDKWSAMKVSRSAARIVDLLKDIKALDNKLILKTQIHTIDGSDYCIRLYLSKNLSKVSKLVQRRSPSKTSALETKNNVLVNVKIGMTIEIVDAPPTLLKTKVVAITPRFIKLLTLFDQKIKNLPLSFFNNKTILVAVR